MTEPKGGPSEFEGRKVIVTGGSRGIGRAIALAFARAGAAVALGDISREKGKDALEELEREGARAFFRPVDVAKEEEVKSFLPEATEFLGGLDILVNNAGICPMQDFEAIEEDEWDRVLAVNLKGVFLCTKAAIPHLKHSDHGCIINISSIAGKVGGLVVPPHYSASKAGVDCLTKATARYLAPHGVRVNGVAPANIETEMTHTWSEERKDLMRRQSPLGRFGSVEEVVGAVLFLASDRASYITGEIIDVNGGLLMD